MSKTDKLGNPYARLDEMRAGDELHADDGFTCVSAGPVLVEQDEAGLFFCCGDGRHYIEGQDDGDGCLVGLHAREPR